MWRVRSTHRIARGFRTKRRLLDQAGKQKGRVPRRAIHESCMQGQRHRYCVVQCTLCGTRGLCDARYCSGRGAVAFVRYWHVQGRPGPKTRLRVSMRALCGERFEWRRNQDRLGKIIERMAQGLHRSYDTSGY